MIDFRDISLQALADRVRSKELAAREVVGHALEVIDRCGELNAWAAVDAERTLEDARAVDDAVAAGRPVGPLAGIPFGVKDLEDVAGLRTAHGSLLREQDPPAKADSLLTSRLRAAGAIPLGKTTTPEDGWMGDTLSPLTGATRNPWDPNRSPGGSSGGTAAALAAGMVPLGTGSDGGGSIRIPASICGLAGLKPSHGRVPIGGPTPPGAGLLAVRGPMGVRTRDTAYALASCVGPDPSDPFSLPVEDLDWHIPDQSDLPNRVVWAPNPDWPVDAGVAVACETAVRRLADAGTEVLVVDQLHRHPPLLDWWTLWTAYRNRAAGHHRGTDAWERIDPGLRETMDYAEQQVTHVDLLQALDQIHHHNADLEAVLAQAPVLLTPTVASETAFSGESGTVDGIETSTWAPFTQVINLTRHPAGSVPCGTTGAGLPVGIQVVGPHHADIEVLRTMAALEDLWADLLPPFPTW
jgi:aspartyl-tRNA(Asn)/glutamyl-tRNA(Gln) amidotransferase subunit A